MWPIDVLYEPHVCGSDLRAVVERFAQLWTDVIVRAGQGGCVAADRRLSVCVPSAVGWGKRIACPARWNHLAGLEDRVQPRWLWLQADADAQSSWRGSRARQFALWRQRRRCQPFLLSPAVPSKSFGDCDREFAPSGNAGVAGGRGFGSCGGLSSLRRGIGRLTVVRDCQPEVWSYDGGGARVVAAQPKVAEAEEGGAKIQNTWP